MKYTVHGQEYDLTSAWSIMHTSDEGVRYCVRQGHEQTLEICVENAPSAIRRVRFETLYDKLQWIRYWKCARGYAFKSGQEFLHTGLFIGSLQDKADSEKAYQARQSQPAQVKLAPIEATPFGAAQAKVAAPTPTFTPQDAQPDATAQALQALASALTSMNEKLDVIISNTTRKPRKKADAE